MMALNIAVPLTTVGDLMDGFGLLSPISPLSVDCRGVVAAGSHGKKQLVSPVGSESSGVSSLDSDEIKKPTSPPTSPTEEVERSSVNSPLPLPLEGKSDTAGTEDCTSQAASSCSSSSTRSSLSSSESIGSNPEEPGSVDDLLETEPIKEVKVVLGGRDVLNLIDNLVTPDHFRLQFAQLPENDNIHFFLDNRSQYHRLGANGHIQEYTMVKCKCCDFRYPVNGTSLTSGTTAASMGQTNLTAAYQLQQQQQQLQWGSFSNNINSIANSRDKVSSNVTANAFNKTFVGGNSNNMSNSSSNNGGSHYSRNGNITAALFGRDSNNRNNAGSFLNNTSTYQNHKSYQQSFGAPNNNGSKFNTPYGQLQQQQFYSKNHPLRYGNGNGSGAGQSTGSDGFNAVVAAAALASQNLQNFHLINNYNNRYNGNKSNNNNNMFAYYKTMM
ncbi:bromodomain-containing protein DDB_G0270170-like [Topomyia yanbarensis]|uniref:bromodomain-containing protein DDB_G0270170-like n=1 Tax=Topomyia yanbarensis TaxID=2498891 RepID=UPI00273BBE02|nr:bromodomain-containing protein DDB_G0270170-like [Topomyia yanbarensis]